MSRLGGEKMICICQATSMDNSFPLTPLSPLSRFHCAAPATKIDYSILPSPPLPSLPFSVTSQMSSI